MISSNVLIHICIVFLSVWQTSFSPVGVQVVTISAMLQVVSSRTSIEELAIALWHAISCIVLVRVARRSISVEIGQLLSRRPLVALIALTAAIAETVVAAVAGDWLGWS